MVKLSESLDRELRWVKRGFWKISYELQAGSDVVATFGLKNAFSSLGTAESEDGCWTFKRVGFWQNRVIVRPCGSEEEVGRFYSRTWRGGGPFQLANGKRFDGEANFWHTRFEFKDSEGVAVVRFRTGGCMNKWIVVEVPEGAARVPELPLLVMLGQYLLVMMFMDAAAASAAS